MSTDQVWHHYGGEECGGSWYWTLPVTTKWKAIVSDHSQIHAPVSRTMYHPGAICSSQLFGHKESFKTLAQAKEVAVEWAKEIAALDRCECDGHLIPDDKRYIHAWNCSSQPNVTEVWR